MPDVADVRVLSLDDGRRFPTKVAGLFLFLPMLLDLDLPAAVATAGLPGSEQIPPLQALLALLVPKLLGKRRVSHISDLCHDEGAGLFAGLNVLPKITYATDYSYKTERAMTERLIAAVIAKTPLGDPPLSFNLDFHAIPFRGDEPDLENHWVPDAEPGPPRGDGVRGPSGRPAGDLLRDGQRPAGRGRRDGPQVRRLLEGADGAIPGPFALRLARDHLCRAEPADPTQGRLHHHPPPRVGHVGTRATPARGELAALPGHPGQGEASPDPVRRRAGPSSTATTATCGN